MWRRTAGVFAVAVTTLITSSAQAADDPMRSSQWYLDAIGADAAQRISSGTGVTVAVVDSGVDATHPDLSGSVINGPDLIDGDKVANDENGHGTAIAGIIAAHARNGIGIRGAAPGVKILAVRVLGANNNGTSDIEARGIDDAVASGAKVINLSLAPPPNVAETLVPTSDVVQALDRAARAGIVVVAAAGNYDLPVCAQPILATRILCVGAVNRERARSSYSNYGVRVDLVAPGGESGGPDDGIITTGRGGGYVAGAGTSEATPQVAAAAAMLMSLGLTSQQAIDRILQTTTDLGQRGPDLTYGNGLLNMAAAVAGLGFATDPPADDPAAAAAAASSARVTSSISVAKLLDSGLPIRCRLSMAGRCVARLTTTDGTLVGRASRALAANIPATLVVRPSAKGRRILRGATRRKLITSIVCAADPPIVRSVVVKR
jgi:serine protease